MTVYVKGKMRYNVNVQFRFIITVCLHRTGRAFIDNTGDHQKGAIVDESSDYVDNFSISSDSSEKPCSHTLGKNSPGNSIHSCCKPYCNYHNGGFEEDDEKEVVSPRHVLYFRIYIYIYYN